MLTDKYLHGIPDDSRAGRITGALKQEQITDDKLQQINLLNQLALQRGQTLAQMALAWLMKDPRVTSVLIGASKPEQLADSLKCLDNTAYSADELGQINIILNTHTA
jgi:L-glyceraldehyde 3-phosphate reductase